MDSDKECDSGSESSADNDNDVFDFNIMLNAANSTERRLNAEFEVLTTDEVVELQREIIDKVNVLLKLPTSITRILLNHFKWDKERLTEKYFDGSQEEIFKGAHLINPFSKEPKVVRQNTSHDGPEECEICFLSLPPNSLTGLECGHRFCLSCWQAYLTSKIITEGLAQTISCAALGCDILVNDVIVTKLLSEESVKVKYQRLLTNSFVECNQVLRWCPAIGCTNVIKVNYFDSRQVKCKCGHVFCFGCGENWHDPVECRWLKKWILTVVSDSETLNYIAANTKQCPQCNVTIDKDGGCNYMLCRNQNCNYHFCWLCLDSWRQHDHFNCFKDNESRNACNALEMRRSSPNRYMHYYKRYANHLESMRLENKLYDTFNQKIDEMKQHYRTWIELQFLKTAVDVLCQCRQTLMYTYVFAYYLKRNNHSMLFELNQMDLESATEMLSEYLECDITSENLADIKQKVQDKYKYCEQRRTVLLDHVHEGYEKDWWDYIK
ncbi:potential E3 ubiquitin-protein ligase ariadne-1-like [Scaptodrosophila lebanonensis]|uniref:RBR-type E3 ubiquitin transferase n=1 Tax=Drosophila lebanonensis TaxID=7225 RepID=A0A6J2T3V0_DROLE|nr:potential E3 ubiquitin-protein ligase ariadne-1-like [Scaptodrosophila lebanonensis]